MKKTKKISFRYKGRNFKVDAGVCNNLDKAIGLMFFSKEKAKALVFEFKHSEFWSMHSFFVFFDFVAVWLDSRGKAIGIKKIKPFQFYILPPKKFKKIIEIPMNKKYKKLVNNLLN